MVTTENVKELREMTGVSIMQCKKALEEAKGDMEKAKVLLAKKGSAVAEKKADRTLGSGVVQAYVHGTNTIAGVVTLSCETDFVAKNEEFVKLAYDIAMQVAATPPQFLKKEDVKKEDMKAAKEVFAEEVKDKPKDMQEKILEGKLNSYFKDKILMEQSFIKDGDKSIQNLVDEATQKFGERIEITSFERFSVGG
jgi:elongation factor Ts